MDVAKGFYADRHGNGAMGEPQMLDIVFFTQDDRMADKLVRAFNALDTKLERYSLLQPGQNNCSYSKFDLIVLHHQGSKGDGSEVFGYQKFLPKSTPAIVIVPDSQIDAAAALLDAGFDRCLPESFDETYLGAVARALTRRRHGLSTSVSHYGPLSFNHDTKRVLIHGVEVDLTVRELQVLETLIKRCGKIVSKEEFVQEMDPNNMDLSRSVIEVYIHRIRKKISNDVLPIRSIKRCGYYLRRFRPSTPDTTYDHIHTSSFSL